MKGPCTFIAYITAFGRSEVLEYLAELERLDAYAYAGWDHEAEMIGRHGTDIGAPHWGWLGDGLGEVRWRVGKTRHRVICSEESERRIVMLMPQDKKWKAFSPEARKTCLKRRTDFRSPEYNQSARRRLFDQRLKNAGD
ncbi:hypothetical protein BH09GEM1_BH09GEM1_19590 [soil metagenome]